MIRIHVENVSHDFIFFKSRMGAAHVVAPGGSIYLGPDHYKASAIGKDAGHDIYPESASISIDEKIVLEVVITNVGGKTLVFHPFPVKLPNVIIKPGDTEALHYVRYKVSTE